MTGTPTKRLRGFINIPQMIQDSYTLSYLKTYEEGSLPWYAACIDAMEFDHGYEQHVAKDAQLVLKNQDLYKSLEDTTGLPWFMWALIDFKECSCHPLGVFHNGEKIVGTGKKTKLVPAGRGPFKTKYASGLDAAEILKKKLVSDGNWTYEAILHALERYNGTGYISGKAKEDTSAYLWARTNINDDFGKYVSDGKYDPKAPTNKTTGAAAILLWLERNGYLKLNRYDFTSPSLKGA